MADVFDQADFVRALQRTSEEIKREVGTLIDPAAQLMANRLEQRYPLGRKAHPGRKHMKDDIRIRNLSSPEAILPARRVSGPRLATICRTEPAHVSTRHARTQTVAGCQQRILGSSSGLR